MSCTARNLSKSLKNARICGGLVDKASVKRLAIDTLIFSFFLLWCVDPEEYLGAIRSHWSIENSLHWILEVVFREDESRYHAGHSCENLALLRKLAISLLKQEETSKASLKTKRLRCGWDDDYLAKVLAKKTLMMRKPWSSAMMPLLDPKSVPRSVLH
jgi:hypothetical protein